MAGPCRYPKAVRIRQRRDFLRLQRLGSRSHTRHLVVIQRASDGPVSRLGVTASKRVGNAVVRNRIKRIVREVFRNFRADLQQPIDVVIIAKVYANRLTYAKAATELRAVLRLT